MKKPISFSVVACLVVLLIGTPWAPAQKVLRMGSYKLPVSLDPHLSGSDSPHPLTDFRFHAQLFETPLKMELDEAGRAQLRPFVCELPEFSEDGKMLVLKVRKGPRFADDEVFEDGKGRPVTAKDVVFSLMRHADPANVSHFHGPYLSGLIVGLDAWRQRCIDSDVADYDAKIPGLLADGDRVVIKLTQVVPQFPALLSQTWASVVPREAIARYGAGFKENPVGSGPFLYQGVDALKTVHFERNPHYWVPGLPRADSLRFQTLDEAKQQQRRFDVGGLDTIEMNPQIEHLYLRKGRVRGIHRAKKRRLVEGVSVEVGYIVFNFEHLFLKKREIREALHLALDREAWIDSLLGPRGQLANSPVPPVFPESASIPDAYPYGKQDLKRARELLKKAGHPGGEGIPELILDAPGAQYFPKAMQAAERLVAAWGRLGIEVQIRTDQFAEFNQRVETGQLQMAWVNWYADYPDVENFVRLFWSKERFNYGRYRNDAVDGFFEELATLNPGPRRTELVRKIVEVVRGDVVWIPLAFVRTVSMVQDGVDGYSWNLLNLSLAKVTAPPLK